MQNQPGDNTAKLPGIYTAVCLQRHLQAKQAKATDLHVFFSSFFLGIPLPQRNKVGCRKYCLQVTSKGRTVQEVHTRAKKPKRCWDQYLSSLFLHGQHFRTLSGATMETGKKANPHNMFPKCLGSNLTLYQHGTSHTWSPIFHLWHFLNIWSRTCDYQHLDHRRPVRTVHLDHRRPVRTVHLANLIWKQQGAPASSLSCVSPIASNIPSTSNRGPAGHPCHAPILSLSC